MSNVKFYHFNSDGTREATELNSEDIAFLKESRVIETHGIKYGLLEWSDLPESEFPTNGLIARYSARGKSNSDSDRDTLRDLTGNGHDITLYNFAYSGMSGYGGYKFPFSAWHRNNHGEDGSNEIIDGSKLVLKNITYTNAIIYYSNQHPNFTEFHKESYRITGIKEGQSISFGYDGTKQGTEVTKDGVYEINWDEACLNSSGEQYARCIYCSNAIGECNITIEQLPLYNGALVLDGVDDYGAVSDMPILTSDTGFTIIAKRRYTDSDNYTSSSTLASYGLGQGGGSDEESWSNKCIFALEYVEGSNYYVRSFKYVYSSQSNIFSQDDIIYMTSHSYNGEIQLSPSDTQNTPSDIFSIGRLYTSGQGRARVALWDLFIYDHDLTEEEINQVKLYLQSQN